MKFKRSKSQSSINVGGNRGSRSLSPYMNKTMTNTTLINPTGNVLQRSNTNLSCILPNNSNKVSNTNLGGSARSNNAFITSEGNNVINTNNNDNVNYYDESIDMKEKELQSYKKEIDDIITNFRIRQKEQRNSLRNKYNTNTAKTNSTFTKNNDISQKAKSKSCPCWAKRSATRGALPFTIVQSASARHLAILLFTRRKDSLLSSIKVMDLAPRLQLSKPRLPVPAKRSSTVAPMILLPIILKRDSFTLSAVGRTS